MCGREAGDGRGTVGVLTVGGAFTSFGFAWARSSSWLPGTAWASTRLAPCRGSFAAWPLVVRWYWPGLLRLPVLALLPRRCAFFIFGRTCEIFLSVAVKRHRSGLDLKGKECA